MGTQVAGIFADGMILQRDQINQIWGTETAKDHVTVTLDGKVYSVGVVGQRFRVTLDPHEAAGGLILRVEGSEIVEIRDVAFGEVFLLAGQSNMELPVCRVLDESASEISAANDPLIRQYRLTPQYVFGDDMEADLPSARWTGAIPGEIDEMSAAGYFFAVKMREHLKVPIGLILNAQGGASIEAWMPEASLGDFCDCEKELAAFRAPGSLETFLAEREKRIAVWYAGIEGEGRAKMAEEIPETAKEILLPQVFEGPDGDPFSGSMWFYKEFMLEEVPAGEGLLYAGELIDSDVTYINGVKVGETGYRYPPRKYFFDAAILRKGKNLIAIRLVTENDFGGFIPEHPYYLEVGARRIELSGTWLYAMEKRAATRGVEGFLSQKLPSGLFRASILPLVGLRFRGALWYQGESNAGEPERYDEKFAIMVAKWREALGFAIPIVAVELADYLDPQAGAGEGWTSIQEQQRRAPETITACGVVSAKDLGAPYELHPQRKKELGERLATECLRLLS